MRISFSCLILLIGSRARIRTALAAALILASFSLAPSPAADVLVNGTNGAQGTNGINGGAGGNGVPGGDATATANTPAHSANSATANGGSGGGGGAGGSTITPGATGGKGGDGAAGGDATATAIATAPSALTTATATAQGGDGGDGGAGGNGPAGPGSNGQPGPGGDATADATVSSSTNPVTGEATATGGEGGSIAGVTALGGTALATAHSTTTGGFLATARASADGRNGVASSLAESSGGAIAYMGATAGATNRTNLTTQSVAALGTGFSTTVTGFASMLRTHGLPTTSDVNSQLAGDSNVAAAYNVPGGRTPLALLAMGLNTTDTRAATPVLVATADYSFDLSLLTGGNLLIGLLDPTSSGSNFTFLRFTIEREGTTVEDQTFATLAEATTYFNDHPLDLGPMQSNVSGTLDLSIALTLISLDNNSRFGTTLLIADVGPSIFPGDYNEDGVVNAADYVVWRKFENTAHDLPNDPVGGTIGAGQYNTWRKSFGDTSSDATANGNAAVPEPASWMLLIVAASIGFSACAKMRDGR